MSGMLSPTKRVQNKTVFYGIVCFVKPKAIGYVFTNHFKTFNIITKMNSLVGSTTGLVHLIAGIIAVVLGGMVLALKKGTKLHRQVGYLYVVSMIVLIISSFGVYRLFGKFGLFHFFSIVATVSLTLGMLPMFKKQRTAQDFKTHFTRMYFSVVGLYAAFAAESFVRVPKLGSFWQIVAWSFVIVVFGSVAVFIKKQKEWTEKFAKEATA